jgi:hypothetical protein
MISSLIIIRVAVERLTHHTVMQHTINMHHILEQHSLPKDDELLYCPVYGSDGLML